MRKRRKFAKMNRQTAKRILIVDDDSDMLEFLCSIFDSEEYVVDGAESGEKALEIAEKELPGLVILDIMMPGLNGWQTAARIRSLPGGSFLPIIFCSGSQVEKDKYKTTPLPRSAFLQKPFDIDAMEKLVYHYLFDTIEGLSEASL